eukprot:scaffold176607_cov25-Prasinocladus_malaysianus.AAC.1
MKLCINGGRLNVVLAQSPPDASMVALAADAAGLRRFVDGRNPSAQTPQNERHEGRAKGLVNRQSDSTLNWSFIGGCDA